MPTRSTYAALADEGQRLGWSQAMLDKLQSVQDRGLHAVKLARAEGVPEVFGINLLGHMHARQSGEFTLRAAALSPVEVLQSATLTAARLMGQEGSIGHIVAGAVAGAWADLLVMEGDPPQDLAPLADPVRGIRLLMQAGRTVRSSLTG